jgi:hypothetical protein
MKTGIDGEPIPETKQEFAAQYKEWLAYQDKVFEESNRRARIVAGSSKQYSRDEIKELKKSWEELYQKNLAEFEEKLKYEASPEGQAELRKIEIESRVSQHKKTYEDSLKNEHLSPEDLQEKMNNFEREKGEALRAKADADIQREKSAAPPPPPPPAPGEPCGCPMKLTDQQKDMHNAVKGGLGTTINPVGSAAGSVSNKLAGSLLKVNSLVTAMGDTGGSMFAALNNAGLGGTQLSVLAGKIQSMKSASDSFKAEADRLSDPATLMNVVGVAGMAGKIGCALGIEGLDVSLTLSVVTENGKTSIAVSGNIQADLDTMLDNILEGTNLTDAAGALSVGINDTMAKMDEAAGAMNGMIAQGEAMLQESLSIVTEYTQVNFLANLVGDGSDPCNTLAAGIKGNLLSSEFQNFANNSLASVKSPTTIGSGFR